MVGQNNHLPRVEFPKIADPTDRARTRGQGPAGKPVCSGSTIFTFPASPAGSSAGGDFSVCVSRDNERPTLQDDPTGAVDNKKKKRARESLS